MPVLPVLSFGMRLALSRTSTSSGISDGNCAFLTSARMAIALALKNEDIGLGDSILVPSFHCASLVAPIRHTGAKPVCALEIQNRDPVDWPETVREPWKDVLTDPVAWAKKCVEEHRAQLLCVKLAGCDPDNEDIGPDEAANEDPRLEAGQVPNLFIVTRGRGRAFLADEEVEIEPGMSIFVPAYVKHVFRNPYDEPLEGILVLFGDNSDFAFGTSYPEYLEDLNEFHSTYSFRR